MGDLKALVIGSGYSGSGAVFGYLVGRRDVANPLADKELRLMHDPGGIHDLHYALGPNFTVQGASVALKRFRDYAYRIGRSRIPFAELLGIRQPYVDLSLIDSFIDEITLLSYRGICSRDLMEFSLARHCWFRFRQIMGIGGPRVISDRMYLPVRSEAFVHRAQKLVNALIPEVKPVAPVALIAINQGGTFWNPHASTVYYGKRKVLVVSRDPRDIFSELKAIRSAYPADDARVFSQWYREIMDRRVESDWAHPDVMHVRFERFVSEFDREKKKIDDFLDIPDSEPSTYDPMASQKNIGKFKKILSQEESAIIAGELPEYLWEN